MGRVLDQHLERKNFHNGSRNVTTFPDSLSPWDKETHGTRTWVWVKEIPDPVAKNCLLSSDMTDASVKNTQSEDNGELDSWNPPDKDPHGIVYAQVKPSRLRKDTTSWRPKETQVVTYAQLCSRTQEYDNRWDQQAAKARRRPRPNIPWMKTRNFLRQYLFPVDSV